MDSVNSKLVTMIRQTVESIGYELVGVELLSESRGGRLLRVYIDHPEGITLDDCSEASHQLSGMLDVADPIQGHYTLEVSSPGIERPLFFFEHYQRFCGQQVRIKLHNKIAGRRRLVGLLLRTDAGEVVVEVDGEQICLPFDQIETARLVIKY